MSACNPQTILGFRPWQTGRAVCVLLGVALLPLGRSGPCQSCQERLQHAVKVERRAEDAGPRISLVFKERLRNLGGGYAGM